MENIINKLSGYYAESIKEILELFDKLDAEVERFVSITGIHCPPGCGHCCNNLKIETTVLEMLPLAAYLWSTQEVGKALMSLSRANTPACTFYQKGIRAGHDGCCLVYKLRPLICRLFGFFTVKDKNGKYVYGSCKTIKQASPDSYKRALEAIERGFQPSNMTDFAIRILAQGSDLGRTMLPINTATRIALEKVGFALSLNENPPEAPSPKAA